MGISMMLLKPHLDAAIANRETAQYNARCLIGSHFKCIQGVDGNRTCVICKYVGSRLKIYIPELSIDIYLCSACNIKTSILYNADTATRQQFDAAIEFIDKYNAEVIVMLTEVLMMNCDRPSSHRPPGSMCDACFSNVGVRHGKFYLCKGCAHAMDKIKPSISRRLALICMVIEYLVVDVRPQLCLYIMMVGISHTA